MIKLRFKNTIKIALTLGFIFISTGESLAQSATCSFMGESKTSFNLVKTQYENLGARVHDLRAEYYVEQLKSQVIEGFNALGLSSANLNAQLIKALANMETAKQELETVRAINIETERTRRNVAHSKSSCVIATGHKEGRAQEIMVQGIKTALTNTVNLENTGQPFDDAAPGLVDFSKGGSTYAYGKIFRDYIKYFCDPNENSGKMPTRSDPLIVSIDGEEEEIWCGKGRSNDFFNSLSTEERKSKQAAYNDEYAIFGPQNMDLILGRGTWVGPLSNNAYAMLRRNLLGMPPETSNFAKLDSLPGITQFVKSRAQVAKMNLASSILDDAAAKRAPSSENGDWRRDVLKDAAGGNTALQNFYDETEPTRNSWIANLDTFVKINSGDALVKTLHKDVTNPTQALRVFNQILSQQLVIGHVRLEQAEKRNLLLATMLAETIN